MSGRSTTRRSARNMEPASWRAVRSSRIATRKAWRRTPEAYERLLLDVIHGDATLFARGDWVEMAWQILGPLLRTSARETANPLPMYEAGSWGPREADAFIAKDGFRWHNPQVGDALKRSDY